MSTPGLRQALLFAVAVASCDAIALGKQHDWQSHRDGRLENATEGVTNLVHKDKSFVWTFQNYYQAHTGRGMWKWSHYLDIYQRHFQSFANQNAALLEIGVQSGGSVQMYQTVLGAGCHYYGMDINKNCAQFNSPTSTIFLGDQANPVVWGTFFSTVADTLDIIIDDGGHQAHQMLVTFQQTLTHLKPGGMLLTEDIHNQNENYLANFLNPAADYVEQFQKSGGNLVGVHMYPFVLVVEKGGGREQAMKNTIAAPAVTVDSIAGLLAALPQNPGKTVKLTNAAWPSFIAASGLKNLFATFNDLNTGAIKQVPADCHNNDHTSICQMITVNSNLQNQVRGVHIYDREVFVEVTANGQLLEATRKGDVWIPYNGP